MTPFFFFNDTATTEIYTLSLHDARELALARVSSVLPAARPRSGRARGADGVRRAPSSGRRRRARLVEGAGTQASPRRCASARPSSAPAAALTGTTAPSPAARAFGAGLPGNSPHDCDHFHTSGKSRY